MSAGSNRGLGAGSGPIKRDPSSSRSRGWPSSRSRASHPTAEQLSGFTIASVNPRRIYPESRGTSTAVPEASCHSSKVDTGSEQLRGGVVPQGMEVAVNAEATTHPAVPMCDTARVAGPIIGRRVGEEVGRLGWLHADLATALLVPLAVLGEDLDGRLIDRDAAGAVGLGVLLDTPARHAHVVAADRDDT